MRALLAGLVLVSVSFGLPAVAQAPDPAMLVAVQKRVCLDVCGKRFKSCAAAASCDTDYVTCGIACGRCMPIFDGCVRGEGATLASCQQPFMDCLKPALASRPAGLPLIRFAGGDGSTMATAVTVVGARNEAEGINAENVWVAKTNPTWRKQSQALIRNGSRSFDKIGYVAPDGRHEVWYDITEFFGKL